MTYIGPGETKAFAERVGGGIWDPIIMTAIAGAESGWNTTAKSPTDDWGLFQINKYYHQELFREYTWYNPLDNTRMAFAVWKSQHYRAWTTYTSGAYEQYLDQARGAAGGSTGTGGAVLGTSPLGPPPAPGTSDYSTLVASVGNRGKSGANSLYSIGHAISRLK